MDAAIPPSIAGSMMTEAGTIDAPTNLETQPVETQSATVVDEGADAPSPTKQNAQQESTPESCATDSATDTDSADEEEFLRKLPPEIGALLVMVGCAGVLLPGVIGTPLIIAGAFVVWPKTFEPMERRFAKMCPTAHRKGIEQVRRFIHDLNRRFPE